MKPELKTKATKNSVAAFVGRIADAERRQDARTLVQMMKAATKAKPKMWGASIVGFGDYHYKSPATGREGDWFEAGFASRANALTLYILSGFPRHAALMKRLGTYKTGKGCLYIKRLADVDPNVLGQLIAASVKQIRG